MKLLMKFGRGELYVLDKNNKKERRRFRALMDEFHPQGYAHAPMMRGKRDLVFVIDGDWAVLMTIHKLNNIRVSQIYRLDMEKTWFLRRIVTNPAAKEKHGDVAVEALNALEEWLRKGGEEAIITLALPNHSGGLYKKAGYEKMGETVKGDKIWFIRRLR